MGVISLLEKLGMDPGFDINDLTPTQRAELEDLLATMASAKNNPILSVNEPTDPDKEPEPEPAKDA